MSLSDVIIGVSTYVSGSNGTDVPTTPAVNVAVQLTNTDPTGGLGGYIFNTAITDSTGNARFIVQLTPTQSSDVPWLLIAGGLAIGILGMVWYSRKK